MKRVLVFRHVPYEGLGTIESLLKEPAVQIEYCDLFASAPIVDDLERYDMVISMGGPMNADEVERYPFLLDERRVLSEAIRVGIPVLGICLGAQMIARALGSRVFAGSKKEIGWFPIQFTQDGRQDPAFRAIAKKEMLVFHWHGDTFDLPEGAYLLASSALYPHQAFRYKSHVYAFQFHIEVTKEMILEWIQKGGNELSGTVSTEKLVQDTERNIHQLETEAQRVYLPLFRVCGIMKPEKESRV